MTSATPQSLVNLLPRLHTASTGIYAHVPSSAFVPTLGGLVTEALAAMRLSSSNASLPLLMAPADARSACSAASAFARASPSARARLHAHVRRDHA